jgi:hypothetical protein
MPHGCEAEYCRRVKLLARTQLGRRKVGLVGTVKVLAIAARDLATARQRMKSLKLIMTFHLLFVVLLK